METNEIKVNEEELENAAEDVVEEVENTGNGFSIFGGMIVGAIAVVLFCEGCKVTYNFGKRYISPQIEKIKNRSKRNYVDIDGVSDDSDSDTTTEFVTDLDDED